LPSELHTIIDSILNKEDLSQEWVEYFITLMYYTSSKKLSAVIVEVRVYHYIDYSHIFKLRTEIFIYLKYHL
jgi:hypothetical protein